MAVWFAPVHVCFSRLLNTVTASSTLALLVFNSSGGLSACAQMNSNGDEWVLVIVCVCSCGKVLLLSGLLSLKRAHALQKNIYFVRAWSQDPARVYQRAAFIRGHAIAHDI